MKRTNSIYLLIPVVLFTALVLFQYFAPEPVDWRMTFDRNHKAPYGCYVLNKMYNEIFTNVPVIYNNETFYDNPLLTDSITNKNLIIITENFNPDDAEIKMLTNFINTGNSVFISSHFFAYSLLDSLKLSLRYEVIDTTLFNTGKDILNFYNPQIKKDSGYVFSMNLGNNYFKPKDSCNAFLLGYNKKKHVNFIRLHIGKGSLFLNSTPLAFTNIHVLYSNSDYAATALSFLPDQSTIIDRYHKPFRINDNSPTQFILAHKPLRIAFYIIVLLLLIYMIFGSKRKQKMIPVVNPLKNTSLEFIKTVGRLYYKSENHADIAQKKTIYFKEYLRDKYFIYSMSESDENISLIAAKTGVKTSLTKRLLRKVNYYKDRDRIDKTELMEYNKDIDEFINTCL